MSDSEHTRERENSVEQERAVPEGAEEGPAAGDMVVAIGASAGGVEALTEFFGALTEASNMAFLVVQHLAPEFESGLVERLQGATDLEVLAAEDGAVVEPGKVYVISPGERLVVEDGVLRTGELPDLESERRTIDDLFRSVGETYGVRSAGVILSGHGSDGTAGLRAIKAEGGLTMAQEPAEAESDSMPRSAIDADVVDFAVPASEIAQRLRALCGDGSQSGPFEAPLDLADEQAEWLDEVTELLREVTGHNLANYKRPTILRRIARRMRVLRLDRMEEYVELLRDDPGQVEKLFGELLIGVTRFFRDREIWDAVARDVVPELFEGRGRTDQVRVWSPGCATGEEAYTLATLLMQHADGIDLSPEVKVFATDIDEAAVAAGREGVYSRAVASDVPSDLYERFFRAEGDECRIVKHVRDRVLFARHDILSDPLFSKLDLVSCRNLLIYLQPEAQVQLLNLLHYALRPGGYLLLGPSETTAQRPSLFDAVDESLGLYTPRTEEESELVVASAPFGFDHTNLEPESPPAAEESPEGIGGIHRAAVLEAHAPASVLIDRSYELLHVIGDLDPYLGVPDGAPSGELLPMVDEEIRPRIRTIAFEAFQNGGEPVERTIAFESGDDEREITVRAWRLEEEREGEPLAELSFRSHAPRNRERAAPPRTDDSLVDQLERELTETRTRLRSTVEQYEVANEKLRASNEELISMNEELQSTTEELETSKEELQSMNEELTTVNDELNDKIEKLDELNADLQNLLRSTEIGTIFLNRNLELKRFTEPVAEYFDLVEEDVGRPLSHVTHRFDESALMESAKSVLEDFEAVERELSTEEDDRHFLFRALPYLTVDDRVAGVVLTFVEITDRKRMQEHLAASEAKFRTVFESAIDPMFLYEFGEGGTVSTFREVNGKACEATGFPRERLEEKEICEVLSGEEFDCEAHLETLEEHGESTGEARMVRAGSGESFPVAYNAKRMEVGDERMVVEVVRDISARKRYERGLVEARERAEELADLRSTLLTTLSHDVRSSLTGIMAMTHLLEKQVDDEQAEHVRRIEQSADQVNEVLSSILSMAQVRTDRAVADVEMFEMNAHLEEIVELQRYRAERRGLELNCELPETPVSVSLDPRFITQIVNNLVENAIEHTDEGRVTVSLDDGDDSSIRIEVADTGCGIPEDSRGEIFERFATTGEDDAENVGLGLAITKLMTEAMGGDVSVESTPGEGARFTVRLPRVFEPVEQSKAPEEEAAESGAQ